MRADVEKLWDFQLPFDPTLLDIESEEDSRAPDPDALADEEIAQLRADILGHLESLNLPSWANAATTGTLSKVNVRSMHASHRRETLLREKEAIGRRWGELLQHIAHGGEVQVGAIDPELVPVKSDHPTGDLFRFATLFWSVPVSRGYGRRMRYLVRDRSNNKLIGIFALADPVFNLRARDEWIGWDVEQRRSGLVHVMDAYVVGAVPPYSQLLGGKLVASLIGSAEVSDAFARRYSETQGIISGKQKSAKLALVTVTSALGRSSLYNRLRLTVPPGDRVPTNVLVELIHIGQTQGYGHFQLSEPLFRRLRQLVVARGHEYGNGHKYGKGPNWRLRVSRGGLGMLGLDPELIRHGIAREVYAMPLATNWREFLHGKADEFHADRPLAHDISAAALHRWMIPRAARCPEYADFNPVELFEQILVLANTD